MKQKILPLLPVLLTTPLALAAPFQPEAIPAEAKWYLHSDLTALRETTTGKALIQEIRENHTEKFAEVKKIFGFNIVTDLTDLTLFGNGEKDEAAVVLSGEIGRANLENVITHADDYQTSNYGIATIHQWDDKGKTQHAAFHGDQTVIISHKKDLVKLGLDVLSKEKPGLNADFTLPSASPVIVAFANVQEIKLPLEEGSRIIRKADSILLTLSETDERLTAKMQVETPNRRVARRMMHVLQGLVSLGELADEKIEKLEIEHSAQAKGKTMTMSISLPTAKTLALLSQLK